MVSFFPQKIIKSNSNDFDLKTKGRNPTVLGLNTWVQLKIWEIFVNYSGIFEVY